MLPLEKLATASFALVLGLSGHGVGWPIARGGSGAIAQALLACLRARGAELVCGRPVHHISELPRARAYVFDVTPKQLLSIAGCRLPPSYVRRLQKYRYGAGVFKMDWALHGPIPWKDPRCARAATVHLSGDLAAVARSEAAVGDGRVSERPFVLLVQPTLFDPSRAPAGKHIAWAYCHVPNGSEVDVSELMEAQIERAAPGFRDQVMARAIFDARAVEHHDMNYVGGDISGGASDLTQLFFRPVARLDPYSTPSPDIFICSSSTPPGGGVHGMCGYWAARSALHKAFGRRAAACSPAHPQLTAADDESRSESDHRSARANVGAD
jgi:phytoene dehydrogenase-like protein